MTGTSDKAASRPSPGVLNQPVRAPRRRTLLLAVVVVLLAAGAFATWRHYASHPPGWLTRWRVQRFLKDEAHSGNFKVADFAFPSKAEMAKKPVTANVNNAPGKGNPNATEYEALREEYFTLKTAAVILDRKLVQAGAGSKEAADARTELAAKETALAPVVEALWKHQRAFTAEAEAEAASGSAVFANARNQFSAGLREQFQKAQTYAEMYQLVGQELWVASRLLDAANPEYARAGLSLALSASKHAQGEAQNAWLAARICEGYVLPHLALADDANRRSPFNRDNLLNECADLFRRNSEYDGVIRTYKKALAQAGTPARADSARAQISRAYEQAGDFKQALHYLREIKDTNDYRWVIRSIPRLEQQLKVN